MASHNPSVPLSDTHDQRIEALKVDMESIIKNIKWPSSSKLSAEEFVKGVKTSPTVPKDLSGLSQELHNAYNAYVKVIEDVDTRIKDAASKSAMWKLLDPLTQVLPKRTSRCTLVFQTCQADILTAAKALKDCVERNSGGVSSHTSVPPAMSSSALQQPGHPPNAAELSSSEPTVEHSSLVGPRLGPSRQDMLTAARKTFKAVEIASSSIPVAGNFVGAAAKVGLAFVETLQTEDRNKESADELEAQTTRLLALLGKFTDKSKTDDGEEIAKRIQELQGGLQDMQAKLTAWELSGRFKKAFSARDDAETFKAHQADLQSIKGELQFLVAIDIRDTMTELRSATLQKETRSLLKCLGDGKYGAQWNMREDAVCFPGTRVAILDHVDNWISGASGSSPVLWICGMAGRGKSTIASTVFENWRGRGSCAIFHFRRNQSALNERVICALARQLGRSLDPDVKRSVLDSVRENEDIADKGLEEQFETLFVTPFAALRDQSAPILLIIDALDECNRFKDAIDFLNLIHRHSTSLPPNVKFLLTSRPELPLFQAIERHGWMTVDLEIAADVSNDLEVFLRKKFMDLRELRSIRKEWPSPEEINRVVAMSQGLFQWARTVVTYLGDGSPTSRLQMLLREPGSWSGLDELYRQILQKAFHNVKLEPTRQRLLSSVLGLLVAAPVPVCLEVVAELFGGQDSLVAIDKSDVIDFLRNDLLMDLVSLLFIPKTSGDPVYLMHTSVRDLLVSEIRCEGQPYYMDMVQHHQQLARHCLGHMLRTLRYNMGDLSQSWLQSSELQSIVDLKVSRTVRYCCLAWCTHLITGNSSVPISHLSDYTLFSKTKLTFWLEVMSLIGVTSDTIRMVKGLRHWLLGPEQPQECGWLAIVWSDFERFLSMFYAPIAAGPLYIYSSALPFCPIETEIWRCYGRYATIRTLRGGTRTWESSIWTRQAGSKIIGVAWSADGKSIAAGTRDGTVHRWNVDSGGAIGEPFKCHDGRVLCLSSNGKLLATGAADDRTVRRWDFRTGEAIGQPLVGHHAKVGSVCFSPDGNTLASGSDDSTIRLWDLRIGDIVGQPLVGHDREVRSVSFSPDGTILASGSVDKTIRLWDPQTRESIGQPLEGHSSGVYTICFSPDGRLLASGSMDRTIRLWNLQTGQTVGQPLKGHDEWISSLCFSPDGKLLVSGSEDTTIRLWNPHTGEAIGQPLKEHRALVSSVCFSPDGTILASGAHDQTVRLWDRRTVEARGTQFENQRSTATCICVSPDGRLLASGYSDGVIQLWNSQNGEPLGRPLEGHEAALESICFSPDGKLLASGACDKTLRLWDLQTGETLNQPFADALVTAIAFSSSGKILASGSSYKTVRLWDTRAGESICGPLEGHIFGVYSICFSPDDKLLVSGSGDKTIRLWNPKTGEAVGQPFLGHDGEVSSLCFSPDGKLLVSGSDEDKTIRLWNPQTGQAIGSPYKSLPAWIQSMPISSEGCHFIGLHSNGYFLALHTLNHPLSAPELNSSQSDLSLTPRCLLWNPLLYHGAFLPIRTVAINGSSGVMAVILEESLSILDISRLMHYK